MIPTLRELVVYALILGCAGSVLAQGPGGMALLNVSAAVPARTGTADAADNQLDVDWDLKLTINAPALFSSNVVSVGCGLAARFQAADDGTGRRRATLVRSLGAPYGIVKYNSGGRHFHVRHLVRGESDDVLRASGERVIQSWKDHYSSYGLSREDWPQDFGPLVIRNRYAADPTGRVAFALRPDGTVDRAATSDTTQELAVEEGWKSHAWPSFAKGIGLLGDSPFPAGDSARLPAPGGTYAGADLRTTLPAALEAARAAVPAHAGRVSSPKLPALAPTWTVSAEGNLRRLVGTVGATVLQGDTRLISYRREVLFDPATRRVLADSVSMALDLGRGRCDVKVGWSAPTNRPL